MPVGLPTPPSRREPARREPARREPAVNLPPFVLGWIALMLAIHGLREFADRESDLNVLLELAFIPARWSLALGYATPDELIRSVGTADPQAVGLRGALARYLASDAGLRPWTCFSYAMLHGSWTHVGLNSVWLAAFGTPVARRTGLGRCLVLAVAATLGGALAQWIAGPLEVQPMIGASAAVSGFMGAAATFTFARNWPGAAGVEDWPPASRWSFLANRSALLFLAVWLAGNLLFGLLAGPLGISDGAIAWQAHIGGLLAGIVLYPLLDPAGPLPPRSNEGA